MAHYAKVENGIVSNVIVAEQDFIDTIEHVDGVVWIQTSYNTRSGIHTEPTTGVKTQERALRKNFAGIGYSYRNNIDGFVPPSPFKSWLLIDKTGQWKAPIDKPDKVGKYDWSEESLAWVESAVIVSPLNS